jgi:hypothetical protein
MAEAQTPQYYLYKDIALAYAVNAYILSDRRLLLRNEFALLILQWARTTLLTKKAGIANELIRTMERNAGFGDHRRAFEA